MSLKRIAKILVGLLILEFVLGILANLYQTVPDGVARYDVYKSVGYILFHVLNGLALLILAIVFLVKVSKQRQTSLLRLAISGFTSIVIAYASGMAFVATNNAILSFSMALGFIGALMSYTRLAFGADIRNPKTAD